VSGCLKALDRDKTCLRELSNDLKSALEGVLSNLDDQVIDCEDKDMLIQVATISSNGDSKLGEMIGTLVWEVGNHGSVNIEPADTNEVTSSLSTGYTLDRGFVNNHFMTEKDSQVCKFKNECAFLIVDSEISNPKEIFGCLKAHAEKDVPLVIIAPEFSEAVVSTLVMNRVKSGIKVCAIKAPSFGTYQQDLLEDIALVTGGRVVKKGAGEDIEEIQMSDLGKAGSVEISANQTSIIKGLGDQSAVLHQANLLEEMKLNAKEKFELDHLTSRVSRLVGGVGKIQIGADTELEQREMLDRAEDAKSACFQALKTGILPGAGIALLNSSVGLDIMDIALSMPQVQLEENLGKEGAYSLLTKEDVIKEGIVDAAESVKNAISNAVSTTLQIINTDSIMLEVKEDE
jgi:chaperonin GroEL